MEFHRKGPDTMTVFELHPDVDPIPVNAVAKPPGSMVAPRDPADHPHKGGGTQGKKTQPRRKTIMSKKTSYHSTNGQFTGKTVTERSGDSSKSTSYKATGSGLTRTIMGPGWKPTSTTRTDAKGNTRTTKY